ncbi:predicted protein [Nematostella vectensis]|uniref:Protein SMG9 n=1 Tax=Nematostella vectensis TaxID=45351 RepID=A7RR33_NEMVE|nr:predicted protein [Nematostella vectensis]|eukprot:XP_001638105.1 predicted protein [Nematostella vectensis]
MEDEGRKGSERGRGFRGGRRRDRGYRDRNPRGRIDVPPAQSPPTMKTPIILTKSNTDKVQESPVKHILLKSRESDESRPVEGNPISNIISPTTPSQLQQEDERVSIGAEAASLGGIVNVPGAITIQRSSGTYSAPSQQGRTEGIPVPSLSGLKVNTTDSEPHLCIPLLDENLHWTDAALESLLDQTDFLVVGAIGLQGTGKSTILSMLAGATPTTEPRSYLFYPQTRQAQENGSNQTVGVNLGITTERIILLDTQALLSPAILDHVIHHDRSIPAEFSSPENFIEMQSLQLVTFLMTVCHVIIVVQDWFADINLMRLLMTAEMLKPSSVPHGSSHETTGAGSAQDNTEDHYPDVGFLVLSGYVWLCLVVFVYNKCTREDYHPENIQAMHGTTAAIFQHSRLRYLRNGVLPAFTGHPSYELVLETLRNQIFSIHRHPLTHHSLTEKNWFHYAARSWDTIRKSSLISEYNRLLSS